jgi:hypothetical protein
MQMAVVRLAWYKSYVSNLVMKSQVKQPIT